MKIDIIYINKMTSEFRESSVCLTKSLSLSSRQAEGIFFTPREIRSKVVDIIKSNHSPINILEPSFGSGEFIHDCKSELPTCKITGVEKNTALYEHVSTELRDVELHNMDFLEFSKDHHFDTIIGNPPYFVMSPTNETETSLYRESSSGRCNIFVLFLYKCLRYHLQDGGILGFVLPTSLYNCSYYEKCRKYIYDNCVIIHAETVKGKFLGTSQDTCILVVKKTIPTETTSPPYMLSISNHHIIVPEYKIVGEILSRPHTTIKELGGRVSTGQIVWNQVKDKLTDEKDDDSVPIVYDHNITDDGLDLELRAKDIGKKRCVKRSLVSYCPTTGESIMVRRGYGNVFRFRYAMVPGGVYGENHVNVISGDSDTLNSIYRSFGDSDTLRFGKIVFGNGSISKTELESVLPIFV